MVSFLGKHAKNSKATTQIRDDAENEPTLGAIRKYTHEVKDALDTARSVAQNPDAMDEVKEELSKGGKGRLIFFFIILLLNFCLGKI